MLFCGQNIFKQVMSYSQWFKISVAMVTMDVHMKKTKLVRFIK